MHGISDLWGVSVKPDQQKYLFDRLRDATPDRYQAKDDPMPPLVRRSKQILDRWQMAQSNKKSRTYTKIKKRVVKVHEVIHAGDWTKALAAVTAFEKEFSK